MSIKDLDSYCRDYNQVMTRVKTSKGRRIFIINDSDDYEVGQDINRKRFE